MNKRDKFTENQLIEALQPIRSFALAISLYHLFDTGLFNVLAEHEAISISHLTEHFNWDSYRLNVFLKYLKNEGIIKEENGLFALTNKGRSFGDFHPWYTMFIGGYAQTFLQIGEKLYKESGWATRNLKNVGIGSCGISRYDAIPLTRKLMTKIPTKWSRVLDMGCGSGVYLIELCKVMPQIEIWGIEPDEESCQEAKKIIRDAGLQGRAHIVCSSAKDFLNSNFDYHPHCVILGFVLHEILAQEGENGVINFFRQLVDRFPDLYIVVIEVDQKIDLPHVMQHGLALAYYNPYYLLHAFTCQRLESLIFYENLFATCGLEILAKETVDFHVDSTGLEIGYLLRQKR